LKISSEKTALTSPFGKGRFFILVLLIFKKRRLSAFFEYFEIQSFEIIPFHEQRHEQTKQSD